MKKSEHIEKHIKEFFESRFDNYQMFYKDVSQNRRVGIYRLKEGAALMDFLNDIMGNVEEKLMGKLIPQNFVSVESLINYLKAFKQHLIDKQCLLDLNKHEAGRYELNEIQRIKEELIELVDYVVTSYDMEDNVIPYHDLKRALVTKNLDEFFGIISSLLASVSYPILKNQEGYLHSNIHLMLKLLGFDIVSEDNTNLGRIDAVIRFSNLIYIIEFKLGTSQEALDQIKDKKYYEKFIVEKKETILVGVGFTPDNRNIDNYVMEQL
jgi:hypothetical protein